MRKVLSILCAVCLTVSAFAYDLNIYASRLKVNSVTNNVANVSYFLNAPATAAELHLMNGTTLVASFPLTGLNVGANTVDVDMAGTAAGTYNWEIKATGAATTRTNVLDENEYFSFYSPGGMAIDNNFESPYFGNIYVTETREGKVTAYGRLVSEGIQIFAPDMTSNGTSYKGNVAWIESAELDGNGFTAGKMGPQRLVVDENGYVYANDNERYDDKGMQTTGLWRMDPASPSTDFVEVLARAQFKKAYNRVNAMLVKGKDAARQLYTIDWSDSIICYPIGNATAYAQKGTKFADWTSPLHMQPLKMMVNDPINGGIWVFSQNSAGAGKAGVAYFDATGNRVLCETGICNTHGSGTVSPDGTKLALHNDANLVVYDITFNAGVPTLTLAETFATVRDNGPAIAFDVAGNLYVASASSEWMTAYPTAKTDNSFTTPAPVASTIEVTGGAPVATVTTITKAVSELADANGWANGVCYLNAALDDVVSIMALSNGKDNKNDNAAYYINTSDRAKDDWRMYQARGGQFVLRVKAGYELDSVALTFVVKNTGVAKDEQGNTLSSGVTYPYSGRSVKFLTENSGTATNGQVRISKFKVVYHAVEEAGMHGEYMVGGVNADFPSLYKAVCAFDSAAAVTGDVTLLIADSLTEIENTAVMNSSSYILRIRPANNVATAVVYTTATDNEGPSGNFVIGGNPTGRVPFICAGPVNGVLVDGYAFDGATHKMELVGTGAGGRTMVVYGAATNIVIRNLGIKHTRTTGTTYCLEIRSEKSTDNHPEGLVVNNCDFEVLGVANAQAIVFNGSQSSTAAGKPSNTSIINCTIKSNLRCIFFNGATNAAIEGCEFIMDAASSGYIAHGIMGNVQSGTILVRNNKFSSMKTTNKSATGDCGIQAVTASGGADVWMIENNYFGGFDMLQDVPVAARLAAVRCGDSCVVRHNTFVMPQLTHSCPSAFIDSKPISLLWLAGTKQYPVQNNLFVSYETANHNSLIRGSLNENCSGNLFYLAPATETNAGIIAGADSVMTFTDFSAEQQAANRWYAVEMTETYKLTEASQVAAIGVPAIADITTDIENNSRHTPLVVPGCYETVDVNTITPTELETIELEDSNAQKMIINGQLIIIRDGVRYNAMGQVVE